MICECALWLLAASFHFPRGDYNETNPGIFVEKGTYVSGIYYNSNRRVAASVMYHHPLIRGDINVSLLGGVVSGYKYPVAAGLRFQVGEHALLFIPPIPTYSAGVVAYSFRFY